MEPRDRQRVRTAIIVMVLAVAAAAALLRVPLQSIFVLGIVLLCPLLMFGMHSGGHHHDHQGSHHEEAER